jgi:hypothetical protein
MNSVKYANTDTGGGGMEKASLTLCDFLRYIEFTA